MPSRGSLTALIVVSLIGGVIVNLAVAWACIWWQSPSTAKSQVQSSRASEASKTIWTEVFGPSVFVDSHDDRDIDPATVPKSTIYGAMIFFVFENRTESLGMERLSLFDMKRPMPPSLTVMRAGWPLRAFGCCMTAEPRGRPRAMTILDRGGFIVRRGSGGVELPWKPLWPGFAVNTLLYTLIVAAAFMALRKSRRVHRRRRGLCVTCAYPTGVSATCSECGGVLSR